MAFISNYIFHLLIITFQFYMHFTCNDQANFQKIKNILINSINQQKEILIKQQHQQQHQHSTNNISYNLDINEIILPLKISNIVSLSNNNIALYMSLIWSNNFNWNNMAINGAWLRFNCKKLQSNSNQVLSFNISMLGNILTSNSDYENLVKTVYISTDPDDYGWSEIELNLKYNEFKKLLNNSNKENSLIIEIKWKENTFQEVPIIISTLKSSIFLRIQYENIQHNEKRVRRNTYGLNDQSFTTNQVYCRRPLKSDQKCCLAKFVHHFNHEDYNLFMLHPIEINYCYGSCQYPQSSNINSNMLVDASKQRNFQYKSCCVASKYGNMVISFINSKSELEVMNLENVTVKECKCT